MLCFEDINLEYIPNFISQDISSRLFSSIINETELNQEKFKMFGKEVLSPRLIGLYGDKGIKYKYANINHDAVYWTESLNLVKNIIHNKYGMLYNSVLVNLYRNGNDYMGYHSDNEPEMGANPLIFSVSLGASRIIAFKHNITKEIFKVELESGSLLIMSGLTQSNWKHSLLKSKLIKEKRINLTFRNIRNQK